MKVTRNRHLFLAGIITLCAILLFPQACKGKGDKNRPDGGAKKNGARLKEAPPKSSSIPDTLFFAPEIIVEGFYISPEKEIFNRSGFVGLIELNNKTTAIEDAADILSRTVGVKVNQYGGLGSFATMSIRGSSSTQVQVYIDGVPLNDAYSGFTDLSDLSLDDIGKIEVYRGFSPTGFGASSVGGTVNLVPGSSLADGKGKAPAALTASASSGSFGTRKYSTAFDLNNSIFSMHAHGGYMESRGDFSFLDDNATPENLLDDEIAARENNDFTKWNIAGKLDLEMPGFRALSLNHSSVIREGGVPGIGADQSSRARLERDRRISWLKIKPETCFTGSLQTDATVFYSSTAESFFDPGGEIDLTVQKTDNRIISFGSNLKTGYAPDFMPLSIEAFLEGKKERFHPVEYLPIYQSGPDRKRETLTFASSGDLSFFDERVIVTYGHRWEWYTSEFYDEPFFPWLPPTPLGKISGRKDSPGAGMRLRPFQYLTIKGNIGRYYRVPTFFEMFGNLGSVTGDSGLKPESGLNRDIGIILSADRFWGIGNPFLEAIYLYNEIDDLILFFPNSQSTVKPENIGSARIRGIELSTAGTIPGSLRLSGNYCWLESTDTGPIPYYNGNSLPARPEHETSAAIEYLGKMWSASWELHYTGTNFLDRANGKMVDGRTIHNLNLTLKSVIEDMTLTIEGLNIGDERASDVAGFPLPGRSFYVSVRYRL
ncbi:MAG: TonB-dependent receptor [Candidatus Krumholzibacteriota bacterium]|nr:TonB-dependent receptor [Candidatus Krumholzibacteriota bacterium]